MPKNTLLILKNGLCTVEYSAIPEFLQQKNANEFVNEVKCSVGSILKISSIADFQKWKLIEQNYKKKSQQKRIHNLPITFNHPVTDENKIHANTASSVQDKNSANETISSSKRALERIKGDKAKNYVEALKEKTSESVPKFIIDVDNIGSIKGILDFFNGFDVRLSFFLKHSLHLEVPKEKQYDHLEYDIVIVKEGDDDDFAILSEALNEDAFIISLDQYKTYRKNNIVTDEWMTAHRIPVTYRKRKLLDGTCATIVSPTIPTVFLKKATV